MSHIILWYIDLLGFGWCGLLQVQQELVSCMGNPGFFLTEPAPYLLEIQTLVRVWVFWQVHYSVPVPMMGYQ